jgi:hypothetical protein
VLNGAGQREGTHFLVKLGVAGHGYTGHAALGLVKIGLHVNEALHLRHFGLKVSGAAFLFRRQVVAFQGRHDAFQVVVNAVLPIK